VRSVRDILLRHMMLDSDGLHPIANTNEPHRRADIVFVHGLGGGSHSTWRHRSVGQEGHFFWPEELGKDLPDCGIWSMGYPAGISVLGKPGMIIEKRAGNLSQKLANSNLGERPLVFLTHSMGGLIVKYLIVHSQTLGDSDRKKLVSAIRGIVFCATPHRGSAFADAAGVLFGLAGGRQAHVIEMRANAEPLDILHEQFLEWHRQHPIPVESYAENVGLFRTRWIGRPLPLGCVVPRTSANPGIPGHTIRDVDDDHLTLVKPSSRQHDVYAGVLRFIGTTLATGAQLESSSSLQSVNPHDGPGGRTIDATQACASTLSPLSGLSSPALPPTYLCYISLTKMDQLLGRAAHSGFESCDAHISSKADQVPELMQWLDRMERAGASFGRPDRHEPRGLLRTKYAAQLRHLMSSMRSSIRSFSPNENSLVVNGWYWYRTLFKLARISEKNGMATLVSSDPCRPLLLDCSIEHFSDDLGKKPREYGFSPTFSFFERRTSLTMSAVFILLSETETELIGSPLLLEVDTGLGLQA
jgi:pimeloyl-ACP methyl ester carboxylesterase